MTIFLSISFLVIVAWLARKMRQSRKVTRLSGLTG